MKRVMQPATRMARLASGLFISVATALTLLTVTSVSVLAYAGVVGVWFMLFGATLAGAFVILSLSLPAIYALYHLPEDIRAFMDMYRWAFED